MTFYFYTCVPPSRRTEQLMKCKAPRRPQTEPVFDQYFFSARCCPYGEFESWLLPRGSFARCWAPLSWASPFLVLGPCMLIVFFEPQKGLAPGHGFHQASVLSWRYKLFPCLLKAGLWLQRNWSFRPRSQARNCIWSIRFCCIAAGLLSCRFHKCLRTIPWISECWRDILIILYLRDNLLKEAFLSLY